MADINLNTILKVRHGTTIEWSETSYTLAAGELGFDTDLNILKIGDGTKAWAALNPVNIGEVDLTAFIKGIQIDGKAVGSIAAGQQWNMTKVALLAALGLNPDTYLIADDLDGYAKTEELGSAAFEEADTFEKAGEAAKVDAKVTTLTGRVSTVETKAGKNETAITSLTTRVGQNETDITSLNSTTGTLTTDVNKLKTDVSDLQDTVKGLTGAMHFVGTSSTDPTLSSGPTIETHQGAYAQGDVCLFGNNEYVYDGEEWKEFGDNGDLVTNTGLTAKLADYATKNELTAEATTARAAEKEAKDAADAAQKAAESAASAASNAQDTADAANTAAEEAQTEAESASAAAKAAQTTADAAMPKTGGAFTGEVTLAANPTKDLGAATKKYVDDAVAGVPAATVTNIVEGENIKVTKSGTEYTIAHEKITTASIPTADKAAKTAYFTGMTVKNGHVTEVTATKLEDGLNALTNTFILDGGKADGSWE